MLKKNNAQYLAHRFLRPLRRIIRVYRFFFLFSLMMLFFILRAVSPHAYIKHVTSVTFLLLIVYSLFIISYKKPLLWVLCLVSGASGIALAFINLAWPSITLEISVACCSIVFYSLMAYISLYFSLQDDVVSVTSLFGSLSAYLFLGLIFASAYVLLFHLNNSCFTGVGHRVIEDFIYFSFVTLTTLGYGDINPISALAKTLCWMEAYLGQAYLTVLMALMVGKYLIQHQKDKK